MPTYDYKCSTCSTYKEAFRKIDERNQPLTCECGGEMHKIVTAPMVNPIILGGGAYQGYQCPITEKFITSRKDRRSIMAEHQVHEAEPRKKTS